MNFKDALKKVYKSSRNKEQLNNPFIVYSRVSDLIGNSYNDKKKVELFFKITKEVNLFSLAAEYGENGRNKIICMYNDVKDLVSKESFAELVDLVYGIVFSGTKESAKPKIAPARIEKQLSTEDPKQEDAKKAGVSEVSVSKSSGAGTSLSGGRPILVCVTVGAIIAIVLGFVIFGKRIPWNVWQWIIGIGGGIVLALIVGVILLFLDDEFCIEYYVSGTIVIYLLAISNFVGQSLIVDAYRIIFICYSSIFLIGGIIFAILAFSDYENGWGIAMVIAIVLTIIFLIIGLILK